MKNTTTFQCLMVSVRLADEIEITATMSDKEKVNTYLIKHWRTLKRKQKEDSIAAQPDSSSASATRHSLAERTSRADDAIHSFRYLWVQRSIYRKPDVKTATAD
jgi:hypothetical protein